MSINYFELSVEGQQELLTQLKIALVAAVDNYVMQINGNNDKYRWSAFYTSGKRGKKRATKFKELLEKNDPSFERIVVEIIDTSGTVLKQKLMKALVKNLNFDHNYRKQMKGHARWKTDGWVAFCAWRPNLIYADPLDKIAVTYNAMRVILSPCYMECYKRVHGDGRRATIKAKAIGVANSKFTL